MAYRDDLLGLEFGQLTVLSYVRGSLKGPWWRCRCACGWEGDILGAKLKEGRRKSCGCGEMGRARSLDAVRRARLPEWSVWLGMRKRCLYPSEPSYPNYGGRGIYIAPEWAQSFKTFLRDMGPRPPGMTIERIDNDGPYSKENCRWATYKEQSRNSRSTRKVTFRGETKCVVDWAAETGIPRQTISGRLDSGWSPEEALTTPVVLGGTPRVPRNPRKPRQHDHAGRPWKTITIDGVTKTALAWAQDVGMDYKTFRGRISHGWDPKRALTSPAGAPRVAQQIP